MSDNGKHLFDRLFETARTLHWPIWALRHREGLPLFRALRMISLGFMPRSYIFYNFAQHKSTNYLTDFQHMVRGYRIAPSLRIYADNKLLLENLIKERIKTPETIALIFGNRLVAIMYCDRIKRADDLLQIAGEGNGLVLKPIDSANGEGVHIISQEGDNWLWDGTAMHAASIVKLIHSLRGHMVQPRIKQASFSAALYPRTTNTIRFRTLIDPHDEKAYLHAASYRIGTASSYPVDASVGFIVANIDLKTGVLGPGKTYIKKPPQLLTFTTHPETGAPIEGVHIPGWQKMVSDVVALAESLSFIPLLGWDGIATDDGICIIEANYNPGIMTVQVDHGVLEDERVRRFYTHYGVI
ncbi:MAG: hypothetical protein FJY67_05810 [Calditrichaeota bacterium]|nr:hypothetical protein [Calditrichota bacterium]